MVDTRGDISSSFLGMVHDNRGFGPFCAGTGPPPADPLPPPGPGPGTVQGNAGQTYAKEARQHHQGFVSLEGAAFGWAGAGAAQ